jgi:methylthioribose-1-phosphate isomerase
MSESYKPIIWRDDTLLLLDQRQLPQTEIFVTVTDLPQTAIAIREMVVRGAPCIGFTAIFGMALWVRGQSSLTFESCRNAASELIAARPTAVNLSFEVNRCLDLMERHLSERGSSRELFDRLVAFGKLQIEESHAKNTTMAKLGFAELERTYGERKWRLMTHCNTGFLACGSLGTALGVISYAHRQGRVDYVLADETRPYLQGTRLTAFELSKEDIPFYLVVEGAASYLLSRGHVDAIFVGADRIAANGDTANKVGTATLAIVAKTYNVPFYVVAPVSSFDTSIPDGTHIEIELRPESEITEHKGQRIAPAGAKAINPSFDVTDHSYITGIICEKGLINPAITGNLLKVLYS